MLPFIICGRLLLWNCKKNWNNGDKNNWLNGMFITYYGIIGGKSLYILDISVLSLLLLLKLLIFFDYLLFCYLFTLLVLLNYFEY